MSTPPQLPSELDLGPFSIADARRVGVPYARLRRDDLAAPYRGVRSKLPPGDLVDRCRAYAPILRAGHAFCGVSAAVFWGMWLPAHLREEAHIDVVALGSCRPPRMTGVRGHHAQTADLRLVDGLPVVSAASTWWQLGSVLAHDELVVAGDSLVRRQFPTCTVDELAALEPVRQRGVAASRRALPHVRARCDSPKETELRLLLVRAGFPEPEVNPVISRPGERLRYGDLVFWKWRVLVEYDGGHHLHSARQFAADITRLEELARAGWTVIRVLAAHLGDPVELVRRVERALKDRGWRGRVSRSHVWRTPTVAQ